MVEENDEVIIYASNNFSDKAEFRIIAKDIIGRTYPAYASDCKGNAGLMSCEYKFRLSPKKVKKFLFQTRPYEWVEFKNVSLRPGQKTDVQIEVEGASKVSEADKMASESFAGEAWGLWRQRKLAEAEEVFKKAVLKDPKNANALNGLGWSQLNQGKRLNAKRSFGKCLEIEPKHAAALNGLGWIAKGQGKTDEAIGHWEEAVEAAPGATAALNGLATTYMELKQWDKAAKYYKMWLKVEPDNANAKAGLEKALKGSDINVRSPEKQAVEAASAWLELIDDGDYEESWEQAAGFFKKAVGKEQFRQSVEPVRKPLGKVTSRKVKSKTYTRQVPGAPDGEYVVIQFETAFENKKAAIETVTPMLDKDGKWRVSGYYVR